MKAVTIEDFSKEKYTLSKDLIIGQYEYNHTQLSIMNFLCAGINPAVDNLDIAYSFRIQTIVDYLKMDYRTSVYYIHEVLTDLMTKVIRIYDSKKRSLLETTLVTSVEWKFDEDKFKVSFSKKMKGHLVDIKGLHTTYLLSDTRNLKSIYSIRIHQLVNQFGSRESEHYSIAELRQILLNGKNAKYKAYGTFKLRVLNPAVCEINEKLDYSLNIEEVFDKSSKRGRKSVTGIVFIKRIKAPKISIENQRNLLEGKPPCLEKLKEYGFKESEISQAMELYGLDKIERNISYVEQKYINGKLKIETSVKSLLKKSFQEDYGFISPFEQKQREQAKTKIKINKSKLIFLEELEKLKNWIYQKEEERFNSYKEDLGEEEFQKKLDQIFSSEEFRQKHMLLAKGGRQSNTTNLLLLSEIKQKVAIVGQQEIQEYIEENYQDKDFGQKLLKELPKFIN